MTLANGLRGAEGAGGASPQRRNGVPGWEWRPGLTRRFTSSQAVHVTRATSRKGSQMAAGTVGRGRRASSDNVLMRLSSETKHSTKTTEFYAMLAIIAGILIASWIIGQGVGNGSDNVDAFPAVRAWLYVAIVGVGYMVSRGLAKAGSRDPYWSTSDDLPGGRDADGGTGRNN